MLELHRLAGALGAELREIDLRGALGEEIVAQIRRSLLEHLVLVFRDQRLSSEEYLTLARAFGTPVEYPFLQGLDRYPEITEVIKREEDAFAFGGVWHSDGAYQKAPPSLTLLYARELPPVGGDTLFANMYLAYDTLSPGLRRLLDPLSARFTAHQAAVAATRAARLEERGREADVDTAAVHPVVRVHPETGRRALYVNAAHSVGFDDMTNEESAPLLHFLFRHQTRPELTCRIHWQPGSLVIWDNRAAQHLPVNDYHGHRRVMHRITLAGDRPQGRRSDHGRRADDVASDYTDAKVVPSGQVGSKA